MNTNNGHYWTILKDNTKAWKCLDDKLVYDIYIVKLKNLSFGMDNDNGFIYENNTNAYLLFYVKKNDFKCEKYLNINSVNLVKKYYVNKITENIFKQECTYFDDDEVNKINNSENYYNKDNDMDIDNDDNSLEIIYQKKVQK